MMNTDLVFSIFLKENLINRGSILISNSPKVELTLLLLSFVYIILGNKRERLWGQLIIILFGFFYVTQKLLIIGYNKNLPLNVFYLPIPIALKGTAVLVFYTLSFFLIMKAIMRLYYYCRQTK